MEITLGQQYTIGEKPTVVLYTYINRHAGTPEKQRRQNSTSSNIIIHKNNDIGYKYEHLEVDEEEQWEITQGSKRQVERTGFLAQYLSGLRHTDDAPHTWT